MALLVILSCHVAVSELVQTLQGWVCCPYLLQLQASSHDFIVQWDCPEVRYLPVLERIEDLVARQEFRSFLRFLRTRLWLRVIVEEFMFSFY